MIAEIGRLVSTQKVNSEIRIPEMLRGIPQKETAYETNWKQSEENQPLSSDYTLGDRHVGILLSERGDCEAQNFVAVRNNNLPAGSQDRQSPAQPKNKNRKTESLRKARKQEIPAFLGS